MSSPAPLCVGQRLRALRDARGYTQTFLAARSGITRMTVYNIETGRTTPIQSTLRCLASALDVTVEDIEGRA